MSILNGNRFIPTLVRNLCGATAFSIAFAPSARAQIDSTGGLVVSGRVVDPMRKAIEGAEVSVFGSPSKVYTSAEGAFTIRTPRQADIVLQVRRIGYTFQSIRLEGPWKGVIVLNPGATQLEEIRVTARGAKPARYSETARYDEVFRRQMIGIGELVDRKQIDERRPLATVDLLMGRPGIKVQNRRSDVAGDVGSAVISFSRCSELPPKINVYIDGHKMIPRSFQRPKDYTAFDVIRGPEGAAAQDGELRRQARTIIGEMLDRINPSDIEMMEIFRGPGELPAEFNDGNCGAIAVWTRLGGRP